MTKLTEISSDSVDEISDHDYVRKFSKQMLKNSLFIGTFQEKRFVEALNSYRDVINVSREEEDFIKNLMVAKKKIDEGFIKKPWVGITEPDTIGAPVGHNLWVELKEEVFGKYWYRVKTVEFLQNEIRLKLDIIRPVKGESSSNTSNEDASMTSNIDDFDFKASLQQIPLSLKLNMIYFYTTIITFENIKQTVIFLSLLIGTIITGGVSMVKFLLEYLLKLLQEFSGLIKAATPIMITLLNVIGRTIQGFYSLILSVSRGKPTPQPVYNSYITFDSQMIADHQQWSNRVAYDQARGLYFPDTPYIRSKPTITPLN